jgi:hypothetical protein
MSTEGIERTTVFFQNDAYSGDFNGSAVTNIQGAILLQQEKCPNSF